jgi:hypothetical protein
MLVCPYQKRKYLPNEELNVMMSNNGVSTVCSLNLLGVKIDHNFTWQAHINDIQKRIASNIGLLYRIHMFLDNASMILFYNAHILPLIDYCINIWGHAAYVHIDRYKFFRIEWQG